MPARVSTLLRHSIIHFVVGLLITIAVSWFIAAFVPQAAWDGKAYFIANRPNDPEIMTRFTEHKTTGAVRRAWTVFSMRHVLGPSSFHSSIENAPPVFSDGDPPPAPIWSRWGRSRGAIERPETVDSAGAEHATGWPCHALWYDIRAQSPSWTMHVQVFGGITLTNDLAWPIAELGHLRALPLRPIWPGLLANTLLYATLSWLLFGGYRRARASLRLRRNHCPRCNYDLRGLPGCPECGWNRPT